MGETTKLIGIGAIVAIVAFLIGSYFQNKKNQRVFRPQVESYKAQIDSLRFRVDTLLAHIDPDFAEKERIVYRTKIKYIIQKQENEKQEYFALDTSGRVAYFRERVRARMRKD